MSARLAVIAGVVLWAGQVLNADCVPDRQERETDFPSASRIRALIGNGRSFCKQLVYIAQDNIDTGSSIESAYAFRDTAGRRFLVLASSVPGARPFVTRSVYGVRLRLLRRTPQGLPLAVQQSAPRRSYEGDIRESDPRLEEIKEKLAMGTAAPAELRLRYGGTRGDFMVYYDLMGRQLFYRYREDRFDRRADKKLRSLIVGQAYLVRGDFVGLRLGEARAKPGTPQFGEMLKKPGSTLEYNFVSARPLRLEQILFR